MRGYPFEGNPEANKVARIILGNGDAGEAVVRTAATPLYPTILLVRRSHLASQSSLKHFLADDEAQFPRNTTPAFSHGLIFDGKTYTFERYDKLTGDCIFAPFAEGQPVEDPTSSTPVEVAPQAAD